MTLQTALDDAAAALEAVDAAQRETGIGGTVAAEIITVARAAVNAMQRVAGGHVTADQAMADLDRLRAGLTANDSAADAALAERFPR
jgi:hypothetical protein